MPTLNSTDLMDCANGFHSFDYEEYGPGCTVCGYEEEAPAVPVDWEAVARREGWNRECYHCGCCILLHRNLDRVWPDADDWEGAARDLGIGDDGHYPDDSAA